MAMTTNGIGLAKRARALKAAGLDRVNVSLDSVDAAHFARITRRDRLGDVLAGLAAVKEAGLTPVKVNAVLDPDTGLDDAVPLLRYCLDHGYQLRIIEQMPLDAEHQWQRGRSLEAARILAALGEHFTLVPDPAPRGAAPAQLWRVDGGTATVGVIASVSEAFCAACDRTRLTADGQVRNCLFAREESDLRRLLRDGADDEAIEQAWRAAMWTKAAGHGINDPNFEQPARPMSAIGG
jgi:cyclic pyranopterin phosphate synthase